MASVSSMIPNALKHLIWDPLALNEAQPANTTESALLPLIDDKLQVRSIAHVTKFLKVLQTAKTEADEALVLIVLRATATCSDSKLTSVCIAAFEKCGGLKLAKRWLNEAVDWGYNDLLVLLLEVLKVLPVQLSSITEARINEPIVKLRKTASEEKVRRASQELLKHWRTRFTEKEKQKSLAKEVVSDSKEDNTKPSTSTLSMDVVTKDGKLLKKRPLKRMSDTTSTTSNAESSKSSGLIGNLMQRKTAKEAIESKKPSSQNEQKKEETAPMQLPTIQCFNASTSALTKKIRWADEDGKELVKVKLIESWRDIVHHQPGHEESFHDAKQREHAGERLAMKSHKDREEFQVVIAHEWTTPALLKLPESLANRREVVMTEEREAQSARTRKEMEFLVLDGEVPPMSPKEWTRGPNEPHRGPPVEIPLSDVDSTPTGAPATGSIVEPDETEEEHALREALGPLQRSTIALLIENPDVVPQVYNEAQLTRNIPDYRVIEIIEQYRRTLQQHQQPQQSHYGGPPHQQGYSKYGAPPPGHKNNASGAYGYNSHSFNNSQSQPLKRKSGVLGDSGGILSDGPPPSKRLLSRGPTVIAPPCLYYSSPHGCKNGNSCQYSHDMDSVSNTDYTNVYGAPPNGGRNGVYQQSQMGMRGGYGDNIGGRGMHGMMRGGR